MSGGRWTSATARKKIELTSHGDRKATVSRVRLHSDGWTAMTVTEFNPSASARERDAVALVRAAICCLPAPEERSTPSVFWVGFVACVVAAGITAKFNVFTLIEGLPRTTDFLRQDGAADRLIDLRPRHSANGTGASASGSEVC